MWLDNVNHIQRIDFYGGIDQTFVKLENNSFQVYHVFPRDNVRVCEKGYVIAPYDSLVSAFPSNLNLYNMVGKTVINNVSCDIYNYNLPVNGAVNNYTYYVSSSNGVPVQFAYVGYSSHIAGYLHSPNYDWFVSSYSKYVPNYYNASDFILPSICNHAEVKPIQTPKQKMAHLFHFDGEELFQDFEKQFSKKYMSEEERKQKIILRKLHKMKKNIMKN